MPSIFATDTGGLVPPAIISALVAAIVSFGIYYFTNRGNQARYIGGLVQKIIEFSMAYPYLEDDEFCASWPEVLDDNSREKRMRYENYCCHVFNTLEHVWEHCKDDVSGASIPLILYPDELIVRHRKWWLADEHNHKGYAPEFCEFVRDVLKKYGH